MKNSRKSKALILLYEFAGGYAIFRLRRWNAYSELVGNDLSLSLKDKLEIKGVYRFPSLEIALSNTESIICGSLSEELNQFLEDTLPSDKKKYDLGICDPAIGRRLKDMGYPVVHNAKVVEIMRYLRLNSGKQLIAEDDNSTDSLDRLRRFQVSLGHAVARKVIKYNPMKEERGIIHMFSLIENLEVMSTKFTNRAREMYTGHFPELSRMMIESNKLFIGLILLIGDKNVFFNLGNENIPIDDNEATDVDQPPERRTIIHMTFPKPKKRKEVIDLDQRPFPITYEHVNKLRRTKKKTWKDKILIITNDDHDLTHKIRAAAETSIGYDMDAVDLSLLESFCQSYLNIIVQKEHLEEVIGKRLAEICPSVLEICPPKLAAKYLVLAGGLSKFAKCSASTVQLLGAAKALFRALKTKQNTPKYGIIFNSTYVQRAAKKNRGKAARIVANKLALAARFDAFSDNTSKELHPHYGSLLRDQIIKRIDLLVTE